eukprot:s1021_g10.t1
MSVGLHANTPNIIIQLAVFDGGHLFIEDKEGIYQLDADGPRGNVHPVTLPFLSFEASKRHLVLPWTRVSNISTFLLSAFLSELQLGVLPSMVETSAAAAQAEKKQKTDQTVAVTKCLLLQYEYVDDILEKRAPHRAGHVTSNYVTLSRAV